MEQSLSTVPRFIAEHIRILKKEHKEELKKLMKEIVKLFEGQNEKDYR